MKKIFYIIIASVFLFIAALISIIALTTSKPTVAFYHVDELVQNVLLKELNSGTAKKYKVIILDEEIPLTQQTKSFSKASLLFAQKDMAVEEFISTSPKISEPSIPVLYDFYTFEINRDSLKTSVFSTIRDLQDFYFYASETTGKIPALQFAGGEPEEMLNELGMFYEALHGWGAYEALLEEFYYAYKNENLENYFVQQVSEDGLLYEVIGLYKNYLSNKIFSTKCLGYNSDDLLFQIDNEQVLNAILKLSDHHKIAIPNAYRFSTVACPASPSITESRKYVAPEICAISLKNSSANKKALNALAEHQPEISALTGLIPANKDCPTTDSLSEEFNQLLYKSAGALMPLSSALPSAEARRIAADEIKYAITN